MKLPHWKSAPFILAFVFLLFNCFPANGQQSPVPIRIHQAVNDQNRVTLRGNTPPLARAEFDRGVAPDDLPMRRMLLLLKRSPEQQLALAKLLTEQQVKGSDDYHRWLTPEEFGQRFGPAQEDIQAVEDWLTAQGFQVNRVAAGRSVIEFSGTAGEVRSALHTEVHRYSIRAQSYWANASDPQIPAALAPVVAGIVSLNNFPRKPLLRTLGAFARSKQTGQVKPLFTLPFNGSTFYVLGPWDFATVYNVLPVWQAGTDGTGQTIAIVGETNINPADDADFRSMWNLPANNAHVILNGPDPGLVAGDEGEADADVQWAGAVAKGATIDLVVSESTETTAGVALSALYIIDNNLATIMSESYGACESDLGAAGNAFYNALWQQGSAEGITVILAAGDSGSDVCDYGTSNGLRVASQGLSVSGFASTPFNVAVGGTDFNDAGNFSAYWNSTNNSITHASAKSYVPERTWNNACATAGINGCAGGNDGITEFNLGGSGGPSSCSLFTSSGECASGYAKPLWQTGKGVPSDGARDVPDVALFAADGTASNSFYPVCEEDVIGYSCSFGGFLGVGGTSLSAPAFAGVMALVVQKTGERQGNADYVLYPLAAASGASCTSDSTAVSKSSCVFYDTSVGNNSVACAGGTPNCSNQTASGYGVLVDPANPSTPAWTTTPGYDRATGLGSVNVYNLVNRWSSVSFGPTTTTLDLSTVPPTDPLTVTHGQPVNFDISVSSASGTPSGSVSLEGGPNNSASGLGFSTLSGGAASGSTVFLPGGSYGVTAHYAGDGKFGASDSTPPVQVTVNPESSLTKVGLVTFDYSTNLETSSNATTAPYGSPYLLRVDVTNFSGNLCAAAPALPQYACPTGNVTLDDNGAPLDLGNYSLNSQGYLEDQPIQLPAGSHSIVANYGGDASYDASASMTDAISITRAATTTTLSGIPPAAVEQGPINAHVVVSTQSFGDGPTGHLQLLNGGTSLGSVYVYGQPGSANGPAYIDLLLSPNLPLGTSSITATYSGDSNYTGSTSSPTTVTIMGYTLELNPTTINIPAPGQSGSSTITLTPLYGFTGTVSLYCDPPPSITSGLTCAFSPASVNITGTSAVTSTLTITTTGSISSSFMSPQSIPPSIPAVHPGRPWLLVLVVLFVLMSAAAVRKRRAVVWFSATALMVTGFWVACGGGSGGGGITPPRGGGALRGSPPSLNFGQVLMNQQWTPAQTVTISNVGKSSGIITVNNIQGADSTEFDGTNTCTTALAPGAACTDSIRFLPTGAGTRTASLHIGFSMTDTQTISLSGTGVLPSTSPGTYYLIVSSSSTKNGYSDGHSQPITVNVQ